jgi:signal transduction histidine kinase
MKMSSAGHLLEASEVLAQIDGKVADLRADLAGLAQELARVERVYEAAPAVLLRDANEQLVLAMMRAKELADRANLAEGREPPADSAAGPDADTLQHLRAANERLVLAALEAKQRENEAEGAYHRQIAFFATVAHELRNPLLPLRLAARLITNAPSDPALLSKLQATITGQVAHLTRLIGDLLDGARLSTGKFRLERSVLDLTPILRLAVDTSMPELEARRHHFSCRFPQQPLVVNGDPVRLVQVFANLLENAAKYTREGGTVRLEAVADEHWAVVTVSDNGIGIDAVALPRIFELFLQDVRAEALDSSGLGIGLAVVRELVEAHGGSVRAVSAGKDQGSEFIVALPLASDRADTSGNDAQEGSPGRERHSNGRVAV